MDGAEAVAAESGAPVPYTLVSIGEKTVPAGEGGFATLEALGAATPRTRRDSRHRRAAEKILAAARGDASVAGGNA